MHLPDFFRFSEPAKSKNQTTPPAVRLARTRVFSALVLLLVITAASLQVPAQTSSQNSFGSIYSFGQSAWEWAFGDGDERTHCSDRACRTVGGAREGSGV